MKFIENKEVFKDINCNIIDWYDFKINSNLLEIGCNLDDITEKLSSKLDNVTVICNNNFNLNKDNVRVINGDIKDIEIKESFDYILIKDDLNLLEYAKKYLKQDGTIILLVNNKLGISNFAGADGFKSICEESIGKYTKNQIENILSNHGFLNYKFFYPLPNYEITNVVFSDDYLPEYNNTKLMNLNIYSKEDVIVFDEMKAIKELTKSGEFKIFANSYFVEVNPKTEVKFVSFNNARKKEYRLCTKIYNDSVVKQATNDKSIIHIKNIENNIKNLKEYGFEVIDREENEKIISKYIDNDSLYQKILKLINLNKIENVYELINNWYEEIKNKFNEQKVEELNQEILVSDINLTELNIVKNAYIDLVFENTFQIDNEFVFFDQEWVVPNLPLEFILYRAINNMYMYNPEIQNVISKEEFLGKFNLLKYTEIFEKTEKLIQDMIIDEQIMQIYNEYGNVVRDVIELVQNSDKFLEISSELSLLKDEEEKKEEYIEKLIKEKAQIEEKKTLLEIEEKKKEEYIESLKREKAQIEEKKTLLEIEEKKKEEYIESLTKENSDLKSELNLFKIENTEKENYIEKLKEDYTDKINNLNNSNLQKDEMIEKLNNINLQKDEMIEKLNEMIKVKDEQINVYENMKAVRLIKFLKGNKE